MKTQVTYTWHHLDPSIGGYLAARVIIDNAIYVFTSPISTADEASHKAIVRAKIDLQIIKLKSIEL